MSRGLGCGEGLRGYRPKGSGRLLSPNEEQEVQRLIQDRTPEQLKMNYALWTRQAVSDLIEVRTGIRLQVRTAGKYLKRWGYTPRNPLKKACEESPVAVGKWLRRPVRPYTTCKNPVLLRTLRRVLCCAILHGRI